MLVFDNTGLPKKGTESVGVAAQYSGTLGKIGNCQVVVSAEYLADNPASQHAVSLARERPAVCARLLGD